MFNVVRMFDEHGQILLATGKMAFRPWVRMRHLTVKTFKTLKGAQAAADRINDAAEREGPSFPGDNRILAVPVLSAAMRR